jgi:predicted small metal-binding protein
MSSKRNITCDCGFSVTTPHGDEELIEVVKVHASRVHPDLKLSRDEILQMAKPA